MGSEIRTRGNWLIFSTGKELPASISQADLRRLAVTS